MDGAYLLPDGLVRPRLRGWLHAAAAPVALALGVALVVSAPGGRATWAALVYAVSVLGLFAASASYHRGRWSPGVRAWFKRVDHAMIYVLIAGTYTPICVLTLDGVLGDVLLAVVWGGALVGVGLQFTEVRRWVEVGVFLALGWVAVLAMPEIVRDLGWVATGLIGLGGLLYSGGAVVYARKSPDPVPEVFGFHEVFHACTIAAASAHYAVMAFWVV
jgi:hemolysin III